MDTTQGIASKQERLVSVDALRGFTMFWIIGGGWIFRALPALSENAVFREIDNQLEHVPWEGFHFYDLIFPMFLFIIGIALPFSYRTRLEKDPDKRHLYKHIIIRTLTLFALGLLCFGYNDPELTYEGEVIGYYGVLQLLAFGYFFGSLIMLNTSIRGVAIWAAGILLFYFLIMSVIPVPGFGAGNFTEDDNFNEHVSKWVADHIGIKWRILLTPYMIPTVSTALLGVLTGYLMQSGKSDREKLKWLIISGIVLTGSGLLLSLYFPIIKNLWSPSYVLFSGGLSVLFLALFYYLIDILKLRSWAFFFVVIGMNSITIYMLTHLISFDNISVFITYGFNKHLGAVYDLVIAVTSMAVQWLFLFYLYRNKIFIKL